MRPDDPRHGTEAGHEQHNRDGETPCDECREGDLKASRRRTKRKQMGHRYMVPLGDRTHARMLEARERGYTLEAIAETVGISTSQVFRIIQQGPGYRVYARTWLKLQDLTVTGPTVLGLTRRVRALMWLGYSAAVIAAETGLTADTVNDIAASPPEFVGARTRVALVDVFDRWHMHPRKPVERYERASTANVRNRARRKNWLGPLHWDDIDDPAETGGWQHTRRAHRDAVRVDTASVARRMDGDKAVPLNPAERFELVKRWRATGRSLNECERVTGVNVHRYKAKDAA